MMALEVALVGVTITLVVAYVFRHVTRPDRYREIPAVPNRLPLIGNAHHLDLCRIHIVLAELSKKLGSVFRLKLYSEEIVVLSDYDAISEALVTNGNDICGRPPMYRTTKIDRYSHSIVWQTYNSKLVFLRKEVHRCLRMHGPGLDDLEKACAPEIKSLLAAVLKTRGRPFDPSDAIYSAISRVMLNLILGTSQSFSDAVVEDIKHINKLFNTTFGTGSAQRLDFLPWWVHSEEGKQMNKALELRDRFWTTKLLNLERSDSSVVSRILTLVDSPEGSIHDIREHTAKEVFTNLILAGTDTTSTTLVCLTLFLLHYPDVQRKLYEEVVHIVGKCRLPGLSDRSQMPYTEAAILELLRVLAHVPLAVPHYSLRDTKIKGKLIPANTTIYINLWAMLHDEQLWDRPWEFRPERFLDERNQLLPVNHPVRRRMLAFGAGRRVCLGEALAKNRLFLFVTSLLQNFQFLPDHSQPLPEADSRSFELGVVLHPQKFKLCAVKKQ